MSELHLTIHGGSITALKVFRIIDLIEKAGFKAELVDNGTIVFKED